MLRPAGAHALLACDLSELGDVLADARDVLGRATTAELAERCAERRGARARDPAIAWVAAEIERRGGDVRVGALREERGLSKGRLVEGFRRQIGSTPKTYARLVRFRRALEMLRRDDVRLVEVALEAGYYDQAHLDTDFRDLGGLCPMDFLATRFADGSGNTAREPSPGGRAGQGRRKSLTPASSAIQSAGVAPCRSWRFGAYGGALLATLAAPRPGHGQTILSQALAGLRERLLVRLPAHGHPAGHRLRRARWEATSSSWPPAASSAARRTRARSTSPRAASPPPTSSSR